MSDDEGKRSLAADLQQRREAIVDRFTVEWMQQQLAAFHKEMAGQTSIMRRLASDLADAEAKVCKLESEAASKDAFVGELNVRLVALETRVEEMSKWAAKIERERK